MSVTVRQTNYAQYIEKAKQLAKLFAVDVRERDQAGGIPHDQLRLLKESGLLSLTIPIEYGGKGAPWSVVLEVIREFAKVDASVAHIFGYHFLPLTGLQISGTDYQKEKYLMETATNQLFWGNSGNIMDQRLTGLQQGDVYVLNGAKGFSSGSTCADYLSVLFFNEELVKWQSCLIPANREGIKVIDDWDGIGQRQTGSGTVQYNNVLVQPEEISNHQYDESKPISTVIALLSFSILTNVFVGSAYGALEEARTYTLTKSRPWFNSGLAQAIDDPSIQRQYGELWIQIQAAETLANKLSDEIDGIIGQGHNLTLEKRGQAAIISAAANVFTGNVALDVTTRIFDVMGARSATTKNGFDRFWRNVRTHTLHNPAEYKLRNIGRWFLTGEYPTPNYYS